MSWISKLFGGSSGTDSGSSGTDNVALRRLLKKLEAAPKLNIPGCPCPLPDGDIVKEIGTLGDVSAIPALKKAREKAALFQQFMEFSSGRVNPMSAGSGSVMIAGLLASQTINTIDDVIGSLTRKGANS
jgi:hypothetical protein